MEDTDFDFDENIIKKRVAKWDHKRRKGRESRFKEFSPEYYEIYDDENQLLGTTLMAVPDGAYVRDIDCGKIIPVEDWDEHIINEHIIAFSKVLVTTNTPSHEI